MKFSIRLILFFGLCISIWSLLATPAHATTYSVTTSSACTLASAITASNTDAVSGSCSAGSGNDTIELATGTYTLTSNLPNISANLTINGASKSSTIIDGNSYQYGGFLAVASDTLSINNLKIKNTKISPNMATWQCWASGICVIDTHLTLSHVTVTDGQNCGISSNRVTSGVNGSNLLLDDVMSINHVDVDPGYPTTCGLIVLNDNVTTNPDIVTITNSSFSNNIASHSGYASIGVFITKNSLVNITNSTISGNHANDTAGIGLYGGEKGITLTNVTITDNGTTIPDTIGGAGIFTNYNTVPLTLKNVLLANNKLNGVDANCNPSLFPTLSAGNNLSDDSTCTSYLTQPGDQNNIDAKIGSLTFDNNTYLIPLLADSPAINAGTTSGSPATDQRGVSRPQGSAYDIGAYEYQFSSTVVDSNNATNTTENNTSKEAKNILPRVGPWLAILIPLFLALGTTTIYILLDWKRHKRKIDEVKIDNNYTLWHHMHVVTLPTCRYRMGL